MYISARKITAANGRMADATAFAAMVTERMNEKFSTTLGLGTEIGGDPNAIWLNGRWESLGEYQAFMEGFFADQQFVTATSITDSVAAISSDQIARVHRAPGDRDAFAGVSTGRILAGNFVGAMSFITEIAELATEITGREAGVMLPVTGDRYEAKFVQFGSSLQELQELDEKLFANEDYLALFARSSEYMEPQFDSVFIQRVL
ncbi:MAG: hypothetical protein VYE07_00975 [Actinomycetota bacterium]|nr:hypothetical protein [Actinomycetota bacterium]MED5445162.1 hypothetical protein [Actinomycetota bacterium]|tara:strand:- start:26 stop:637 length:612 start_codon:yes stop_codon:yes gene_type:complete